MSYEQYMFLYLILLVSCFISLILGIFNTKLGNYIGCGTSIALVGVVAYAYLFDEDY